LKAARGRGGLVENLLYTDIEMRGVRWPIQITSYYLKIPGPEQSDTPQPLGPLTPIWRGIVIRNLTAVGSDAVGVIIGVPEMPVSDVTMQNVRISAKTGLRLRNVRGLRLVNTKITTETGAPLLEEENVAALTRSEPAAEQSQ
jgi:hypothetical protein